MNIITKEYFKTREQADDYAIKRFLQDYIYDIKIARTAPSHPTNPNQWLVQTIYITPDIIENYIKPELENEEE